MPRQTIVTTREAGAGIEDSTVGHSNIEHLYEPITFAHFNRAPVNEEHVWTEEDVKTYKEYDMFCKEWHTKDVLIAFTATPSPHKRHKKSIGTGDQTYQKMTNLDQLSLVEGFFIERAPRYSKLDVNYELTPSSKLIHAHGYMLAPQAQQMVLQTEFIEKFGYLMKKNKQGVVTNKPTDYILFKPITDLNGWLKYQRKEANIERNLRAKPNSYK